MPTDIKTADAAENIAQGSEQVTQTKRNIIAEAIKQENESDAAWGTRIADSYQSVKMQAIGAGVTIFVLLLAVIFQHDIMCMISLFAFFLPVFSKYLFRDDINTFLGWMINIGTGLSVVVLLFDLVTDLPSWVLIAGCWVCLILSCAEAVILCIDTAGWHREYNNIRKRK